MGGWLSNLDPTQLISLVSVAATVLVAAFGGVGTLVGIAIGYRLSQRAALAQWEREQKERHLDRWIGECSAFVNSVERMERILASADNDPIGLDALNRCFTEIQASSIRIELLAAPKIREAVFKLKRVLGEVMASWTEGVSHDTEALVDARLEFQLVVRSWLGVGVATTLLTERLGEAAAEDLAQSAVEELRRL